MYYIVKSAFSLTLFILMNIYSSTILDALPYLTDSYRFTNPLHIYKYKKTNIITKLTKQIKDYNIYYTTNSNDI